jgi:hypothetical protein
VQDDDNQELTLKQKSMDVLKLVIKRRANEFFEAEVEGCGSGT